MKDRVSITGVPMSIENRSQVMLRFIVNATCINGAKSELRGAIITFDDVTVLHQTNEDLNNSLEQLRIMQATIEKKNEQLKVLASTDPLTNCLNRRTFFARLDEEASRARPGGLRVAILMVDGDRFKSINDRFGHAVGDRVLIGLVEVMRQTVSEQDLVGRYGGEEFCVALIGRSQVEAEDLAERIRSAVAEDHGWLPNAERVTVSIGLAATLDDGQPPIADLVHRADEALYAAKSGGRNRVMSWTRLHPLAHSLAS
jgi:diguanylate cyclase (GGDEF)-like protein